MCAETLITKYSALDAVPLVVCPLNVQVFTAPALSIVASKSPLRHPSPAAILPAPSEGFPKSRKSVLNSSNVQLKAEMMSVFMKKGANCPLFLI